MFWLHFSRVGFLFVHFALLFFTFESFNLMVLEGWVVVNGKYVIVCVIIEWVWEFA